LEARVTRLERVNRWLIVGCAMAVVIVVAAFTQGGGAVQDLVRARQVHIVDESGRVRIELRHDSMETGVFLRDGAGDIRVGAAQFAHGGGGFALHGPEMKGAAVLYLKGDGSLTFIDEAGEVVARIPSEDDGR
jgi:hypothetical protein